VSLVRPPCKAHVEVVALTVEQARALLAAAAGNRFEALSVLAVKSGMRRGELLALRWEDVDLDKGMIQVAARCAEPARDLRSAFQRPPHLDARWVLSPSLLAALRRHRARQEEERQGSVISG
jgi:integrase